MEIRFGATVLASFFILSAAWATQPLPEVQAHVGKAYEAAGENHRALVDAVCHPRVITPEPGKEVQKIGAKGILPDTRIAPDYATWHREPVRVFDNLVFVGQSEFTAWAVIT